MSASICVDLQSDQMDEHYEQQADFQMKLIDALCTLNRSHRLPPLKAIDVSFRPKYQSNRELPIRKTCFGRPPPPPPLCYALSFVHMYMLTTNISLLKEFKSKLNVNQ